MFNEDEMKINKLLKGLACSLAICAIPSVVVAGQYTHTYNFENPTVEDAGAGKQIIRVTDTWLDQSEIGAPILPSKFSNIYLPEGESIVSITIEPGNEISLSGNYDIVHAEQPVPTQFEGPSIPTPQDFAVYGLNEFYPQAVKGNDNLRYLRGVKIARTELNPVKYNPVTGEVKFYNTINVIIETEEQVQAASTADEFGVKFRNISTDNSMIIDEIDNKSDFNTDLQPTAVIGEARQYIVITTAALELVYSKLTDFRSTYLGGGYTTHIETIENIEANYSGIDRAEKIRNYIIDSYNNNGTQFVVLGGDADGAMNEQMIPIRGTSSSVSIYSDQNIPTDLYYGCLDGTWNSDNDNLWGEHNDGIAGGDIDWDSEVYVGRIAADNAIEANNHIDKIIAFETSATHKDKALLLGQKLNSDPTWGGDRVDWVYEAMSPEVSVDKLYDRDLNGAGVANNPDNIWSKSDFVDMINSNEYLMLHHLGHSWNGGVMSMSVTESNDDMSLLTNSDFFFVYTQGCYSSSIDNKSSGGIYLTHDAMGESFTNLYGDRGAFAYIGNSRYGWYSRSSVTSVSNLAHKYFVESIYDYGKNRVGVANQHSKSRLSFSNSTNRWIAFETNLIGDPVTPLKDFVQVNSCSAETATIAEHEAAGRVEQKYGILYYVVGSNEYLGITATTVVSLAEDSPGFWRTVECSSADVAPEIASIEAKVEGFNMTVQGLALDNNGDLTKVDVELNGNGTWITAYGLNNWIYTFQNLESGEHTIKAIAYDSKGNVSATAQVTASVQGPSAPTIDSHEVNVYQKRLIVNGIASDVDGDLTIVKIKNDVFGEINCTNIPEFGCIIDDLVPGESYDFYLVAQDAAGLLSAEYGPIEIVMPGDHPPVIDSWSYEITDGDLIVSGISSDVDNDILNTVLYVSGGGITCDGLEQWSCVIQNMPAGTHSLIIKTSDDYLNSSELINFDVTVEESAAPTIDSYDWSLDGDVLTITGTASDLDGDLDIVILTNGPGSMLCEGTDNFVCTLADLTIGEYSLYIAAQDVAGNSSENAGPIVFTYAGQAPTIDTHEYTVDGLTVTFTGTASDVDGDLDRVLLALGAAGAAECTGTTNFTCTWDAPQIGTYSLGVVAVDAQENYGVVAGPYDIEIVDQGGECITDTNYNHVAAERAYVGGIANLYAYGVGSDDDLGLYGSVYYSVTTSLEETSAGVWSKVTSCP